MKTNFVEKFSITCPGLLIECTKFGWWYDRNFCGCDPIVFGEFVATGTSPTGERFAFAGTGRDLRDLCSKARAVRNVLEDRLAWSGAPERAPR